MTIGSDRNEDLETDDEYKLLDNDTLKTAMLCNHVQMLGNVAQSRTSFFKIQNFVNLFQFIVLYSITKIIS